MPPKGPPGDRAPQIAELRRDVAVMQDRLRRIDRTLAQLERRERAALAGLTAEEAAGRLGVSVEKVRRSLKARTIRGKKDEDGRWRVPEAEMKRLERGARST